MEKRRHPRMLVGDLVLDVSDGLGCCSGTAQDVSRSGLCLIDLSKRFGKNIATYTVIAATGSGQFRFRVRPRWEQAGRTSKRVGVEIDAPSWQWIEYVRVLETRQQRK